MKFIGFILFISLTSFSTPAFYTKLDVHHSNTASIKEQAFQVLKTKCNVCHEKKNKRMVFTPENMEKRAKKINRQVFKWKRMPKGNAIKLTKEERTKLKAWITSLK